MIELEPLGEKGRIGKSNSQCWKNVQHVVLGTEAQRQVELPKQMETSLEHQRAGLNGRKQDTELAMLCLPGLYEG